MRRLTIYLSALCLISVLCTGCSTNKSSSSDSAPPGGTAPVADFSASPTSGSASLDVQFTSSCTGTVDTYSWDFGDGGSSTEANPSHTYHTDGTYTVVLTVVGPGGSDTEVKHGLITVGGGGPGILAATFIGTPTSGTVPLEVQFSDTSTPAGTVVSWSWNFGDGGSSTEQNPTYQYTTPGTYTVSLTVGDGADTHTEIKDNYITVNDTPTGTDDWVTLNSGTSRDLYGIDFASTTVGWAVGSYDTLLYTNDGGNSWSSQFENIGGMARNPTDGHVHKISPPPYTSNAHFRCVHAVDTSNAWVSSLCPCQSVTEFTPCFVTNNGGDSWTCVITATNFQEWGIFGFDGANARVCTMGSPGHNDSDVHHIVNGYSDSHYSVGWEGLHDIVFADSSTGWTCGDGGVLKSTNSGSGWSNVSGTGGYPLWGIDCTDTNHAWACGASGRIIATTDGSTWDVQTSGVSVGLWDIDFIDANNGWCVGEGGTILVTTDGGTTWTPEDSGVSNTLTDVSAVDAAHVWVCGGSGTILRSK